MSKLYAYFGHHKCASTWIHRIVDEVCKDMGLNHVRISNSRDCTLGLSSYLENQQADFLSYTNAVYAEICTLKNLKAFHVIRDPRDVLVSGYFSHLKSHPTNVWPELKPHREKLQSIPISEGLLEEFSFSQRFLNEMAEWDYNDPRILQLKMENMILNPYTAFLEIFAFLDLLDDFPYTPVKRYFLDQIYLTHRILRKTPVPVPVFGKRHISSERLLGIVHFKSFKFLSGGRKEGEEHVGSHYRKGTPGDWKNYFTQTHAERFINTYGDLLIQLGYEEDHSWATTLSSTALGLKSERKEGLTV